MISNWMDKDIAVPTIIDVHSSRGLVGQVQWVTLYLDFIRKILLH